MNTIEPNIVYYALHKATPPICEDNIVGGNISMRLTDEEQEFILEKATQVQPLDSWLKDAASFFDGCNIYYRNSRWSNTSKLILVDTSTGYEVWLYKTKDDNESASIENS